MLPVDAIGCNNNVTGQPRRLVCTPAVDVVLHVCCAPSKGHGLHSTPSFSAIRLDTESVRIKSNVLLQRRKHFWEITQDHARRSKGGTEEAHQPHAGAELKDAGLLDRRGQQLTPLLVLRGCSASSLLQASTQEDRCRPQVETDALLLPLENLKRWRQVGRERQRSNFGIFRGLRGFRSRSAPGRVELEVALEGIARVFIVAVIHQPLTQAQRRRIRGAHGRRKERENLNQN
mmetsp:Transcript_14284/g.53779  ORF Transcript_14284/g.53779 Transcript_14284/m.53779 type:complete len:232 (-) Transcript_14284:2-697(-)